MNLLQILFTKTFEFVNSINYFELAVILALESTCFPVLIPIETFMIPMGYLVFTGKRDIFLLLTFSVSGIVVGCLTNYYMAKTIGRPLIYKYSKFLMIKKKNLEKWEKRFLQNSKLTMFIGRFIPIPAVKHIITIPAGISRMNIIDFIIYNAFGGLVFSAITIGIGYYFGQNAHLIIQKIKYIGIGSLLFIIIIIIGYQTKKTSLGKKLNQKRLKNSKRNKFLKMPF